MKKVSFDDVVKILDLKPLEHEGGFHRQTYIDKNSTCIYYLVGGDEQSALHRLTGPEGYHWYAGAPLLLTEVDESGKVKRTILSNDLLAGHVPQKVVPAGVWQGSCSMGEWTLVGTTMAPGFEWNMFELAPEEMRKEIPLNVEV